MDVKLGKIPDGGGWKAHGRQMGSTAARKRTKVGYDCVHSLVDDHSRLAYSEIMPRLNRTLATEWAYRQVFTSNDERTAALAPWIEYYNTERPHSAPGGLPPSSRLPPTSWPGTASWLVEWPEATGHQGERLSPSSGDFAGRGPANR
jgi:hypothetical protein